MAKFGLILFVSSPGTRLVHLYIGSKRYSSPVGGLLGYQKYQKDPKRTPGFYFWVKIFAWKQYFLKNSIFWASESIKNKDFRHRYNLASKNRIFWTWFREMSHIYGSFHAIMYNSPSIENVNILIPLRYPPGTKPKFVRIWSWSDGLSTGAITNILHFHSPAFGYHNFLAFF